MRDEFQKYTYDYWQGRDLSRMHVPDSMMDDYVRALGRAMTVVDRAKIIPLRERAIRRHVWTVPSTMAFVRQVWTTISPRYAGMYERVLHEKPVRLMDARENPDGKSTGHCKPGFIVFGFDHTLCDPIYMAHESGHLLATVPTGKNPDVRNVLELQAFFVQEAAYDVLMGTQHFAQTAHLHRLEEYGSLGHLAFRALNMLARKKPGTAEQDVRAHIVHYHPFAAAMMMQGYARFKAMTGMDRDRALDTLFMQGDDANIGAVIGAFGIDVRAAGRDMAAYLRAGARHWDVTDVPAAGQP